jgi:hypothetical protein
MKTIALLLVLASAPLLGSGGAQAATAGAPDARSATQASHPAIETSARKKVRRQRYVDRSYRYSYGYDRPYRSGYYRGVRPGWGYGPDPGDYAWPPFHFKPYW